MAVASDVSTAAFVVNILFMIALVQSGGGLFAGCKTFGFFDILPIGCFVVSSRCVCAKSLCAKSASKLCEPGYHARRYGMLGDVM